jgi:hypothetical protein
MLANTYTAFDNISIGHIDVSFDTFEEVVVLIKCSGSR